MSICQYSINNTYFTPQRQLFHVASRVTLHLAKLRKHNPTATSTFANETNWKKNEMKLLKKKNEMKKLHNHKLTLLRSFSSSFISIKLCLIKGDIVNHRINELKTLGK